MGSRGTEIDDNSTADSTPDDVSVLYSWAKLQGAKYRDYSASRREYRAQVRYRAAKALLERELRAQVEAEASAVHAERIAMAAEATARSMKDAPASQSLSMIQAEEAKGKAAAERVEAARRAEASARLAVLALREEREIAEAHSSARLQAEVYEGAEQRRRQLAGPQPFGFHGAANPCLDPCEGDLRSQAPVDLQQLLFAGQKDSARPSFVPGLLGDDPRFDPTPSLVTASGSTEAQLPQLDGRPDVEEGQNAPAWLFPAQSPSRPSAAQTGSQDHKADAVTSDTLLASRERVAARWFALKGVFEDAGPELAVMQPVRPLRMQMPLLALFSLAGGVGKTSLVATLGRALSSHGEKVVLVDATSHGLLPIYFGLHAIRQGIVRTVEPRPQSAAPPISLVIHDLTEKCEDERQRETLVDELLQSGEGKQRLVLDLSTGSDWLIRRVADLHPTVLVPMAPDMNSVISLQAVERLFYGIVNAEGRPLLPFYVLNQFDASLPLHLDIREVFRRQLGDRLLRVAIRRSQAVSEALAEGMTVLDYAPDAAVAQDYRDIASWLRGVSPPAVQESPGARWGAM